MLVFKVCYAEICIEPLTNWQLLVNLKALNYVVLRILGFFVTFNITHLKVVEAAGIEPASENQFPQLSTSVVYLLTFPARIADKQAMRESSSNTFLRCEHAVGTFTTNRCPVKAVVLSYRTDADLGSNL